MDSAIEKAIKKEIEKAYRWYEETYGKELEVHARYDRQEQHFSWRIIAKIGGQDRIIPLGLSVAKAESSEFFEIKAKIFPYLKATLTGLQRRYEPIILLPGVHE